VCRNKSGLLATVAQMDLLDPQLVLCKSKAPPLWPHICLETQTNELRRNKHWAAEKLSEPSNFHLYLMVIPAVSHFLSIVFV